jgi:hypothetical protein
MPTVLRIGKLRIVIYTNDHRPEHVHVIGPQGEAVFDLHCPRGAPELRESMGFALHELNKVMHHLQSVLHSLCDQWSSIHGID